MRRGTRTLLFAASLAVMALTLAMPAQASDIIEVMAVVEGVFVGPGGATVAQLEWGVRTHSDAPTMHGVLNAYIVFSNHVRQQVFPPEAFTLEPDSGIIKLAFVILPNQAGLGTATFHVEARAGGGGMRDFASATDTFEVTWQLSAHILRHSPPPPPGCTPYTAKRKGSRRVDRTCGFDVL